MEEAKRAFGYVCPHCGKAVYAERTLFAMAAGPMDVICACGKSTLHMEADSLQRYHLQVPCGVCGGTHDAKCEEKELFTGRGIGLACAKTQQLCCYIGWPEEVRPKLEGLEDLGIILQPTRIPKDRFRTVDSILALVREYAG